MLEDLADRAVQFALESGAHYCDVRAEVVESNGFVLENGQVENVSLRFDDGLGIRVLAEGSWGFCSFSHPISFDTIREGIIEATRNALYCSQTKRNKVSLADVKAQEDRVVHKAQKRPHIEEMVSLGSDCDKIVREGKRIVRSSIRMHHDVFHKYYVNSEGSKITQDYDDLIAELSSTARESGISETTSTTEGGRGGLELISGKNDILAKSALLSERAGQLVEARAATEEKAVVVMNPDFVALLTHEILGHPSEGDRVLGREMAWAGGSWWAGMLGEKIGSDELSVYDDPTIGNSLGSYKYDDEGVPAARKSLIEEGVLVRHMQSRETAAVFGTEPDSSMRSAGYSFMPLIRMACTVIGPGNWNSEEMIKEVREGYLICDMKVPSIDMMRYNWSISCQYAQKIEKGELKGMVRDVIVMGTAPEFFRSIDARSKDFAVRPITNCGKGDPMQIMRMGNGGPFVRGIATVKSVGQ